MDAGEVSRLFVVRNETWALVAEHPFVADAIRKATIEDYPRLVDASPPVVHDEIRRGESDAVACESSAHPASVDPDELRRLGRKDYLIVALWRLGGLADTVGLNAIVEEPQAPFIEGPPLPATEANMRSPDQIAWRRRCAWRIRFPVEDGPCLQGVPIHQRPLSPAMFPPDVAERMLADVKAWARHQAMTCVPGVGDNSHADAEAAPAGADESAGRTLKKRQARVLRTLAKLDASRLVSVEDIALEMEPGNQVSARTIGPTVRKLIQLGLAERPDGERSGVRLTVAGRRLASKIAD